MRQLVPFFLLLAAMGSACQCGGASTATKLTFRFKNTSKDALYLSDQGSNLGFQLQNKVSGVYSLADEDVPPSCQSCADVCSGTCVSGSEPAPRVVRVDPGTQLERVWSGVFQQTIAASCGALVTGGKTCERTQNATPTETFNLHLCYATTFTGDAPADGGTTFEGDIPAAGQECLNREFEVKDGTVELTPLPGATCTTSAQCKAANDELCFDGSCTRSCPLNAFPRLGQNWQLSIPLQDDNYFTTTTVANQTRWTGTGVVGNVFYSGETMKLDLHTPDNLGTATVYATIPKFGVPFELNETVSVTLVGASDDPNHINLALVIRDAGGVLLLAADTAHNGYQLSASDTAPFTLSSAGKTVGCDFTPGCGKVLYDATDFAGGVPKAELNPGDSTVVTTTDATFTLLNIGNSTSTATQGCNVKHPTPYAILNQRLQKAP